jgi:hypothetical protein
MSNWYKWESIESFELWHVAIKNELGLPKQSVTFEGLEVANGVITNQYTNAIIVAENDIRAAVELNYADGLTPSEDPYRSDY